MKEIYVIISGAYSDWEILGFCETEEEAIKSCIKYNRGLDEDNWDSAYYLKTSKFNVRTLELIKPNYVHRVYAEHYPEGWKFYEHIDVSHDAQMSNHTDISNQSYPVCSYDRYANIYVCLKEINRPRALKIAQDMLYQKLAEVEEL